MITARMSDKDTPEDLIKVFDLFIGDDTADKIELKHLKRVAKELLLYFYLYQFYFLLYLFY